MSRRSAFVDAYIAGDASRASALDYVPKARAKPTRATFDAATERALRRSYHPITSMDAYSRHKMMINNYVHFYGKPDLKAYVEKVQNAKTDMDVLRDNHRFLWDASDDDPSTLSADDRWSRRLAKRYYDRLFKEYALADLSRYKENKVGFRWRTEEEVIRGKGQFICGNKKCSSTTDLKSYEVNFGYREHGVRKNALVKVRVCPRCAVKMFHKKVKEMKRQQREDRHKRSERKKKKKSRETSRTTKRHRRDSSSTRHRKKHRGPPHRPATPDSTGASQTEGQGITSTAVDTGSRDRHPSGHDLVHLARHPSSSTAVSGERAMEGAHENPSAQSGAGSRARSCETSDPGKAPGTGGRVADQGAGTRSGSGAGAGSGASADFGDSRERSRVLHKHHHRSPSPAPRDHPPSDRAPAEAEPPSRQDAFDAFFDELLM